MLKKLPHDRKSMLYDQLLKVLTNNIF